jgi:hypothetical protein
VEDVRGAALKGLEAQAGTQGVAGVGAEEQRKPVAARGQAAQFVLHWRGVALEAYCVLQVRVRKNSAQPGVAQGQAAGWYRSYCGWQGAVCCRLTAAQVEKSHLGDPLNHGAYIFDLRGPLLFSPPSLPAPSYPRRPRLPSP